MGDVDPDWGRLGGDHIKKQYLSWPYSAYTKMTGALWLYSAHIAVKGDDKDMFKPTPAVSISVSCCPASSQLGVEYCMRLFFKGAIMLLQPLVSGNAPVPTPPICVHVKLCWC